jgi:hypothetical protein
MQLAVIFLLTWFVLLLAIIVCLLFFEDRKYEKMQTCLDQKNEYIEEGFTVCVVHTANLERAEKNAIRHWFRATGFGHVNEGVWSKPFHSQDEHARLMMRCIGHAKRNNYTVTVGTLRDVEMYKVTSQ